MSTDPGQILLSPGAVVTEQGCLTEPTLSSGHSMGWREASERARERIQAGRIEAIFVADWTEAAFLHFEVDGELLQRVVPFALHPNEGRCFITLVAFTMNRLRLRYGGRATGWVTALISNHRFLNLRTYVDGRGGEGIFFMREWLDNRLAVKLGPLTFGLPYRYATLDYAKAEGEVSCRVESREASGGFSGRVSGKDRVAEAGSLDAFFLERYTAYTAAGLRPMFFRVWHPAWQFRSLEIDAREMDGFLRAIPEEWVSSIRFCGAAYSEGVKDVWMGRPHLV